MSPSWSPPKGPRMDRQHEQASRGKVTGLSWWLSGEGLACQYMGHGFDPWSRKISQAAGQLSPCTTTIEPVLQKLQVTTTEA